MITRYLLGATLVALLTGVVSAGDSVAQSARPDSWALGVAVTPRHFPNFDATDVDDAFVLTRAVSDHAVFIYQWGELDLPVARAMVARAKHAGLKPIVGLSPTTLDQGRKELDLPVDVRRRAGPVVSFANPAIREAYIRTAADLAALRVPYLCLATEINFLAMQRLDEYLHFASLYKEAYVQVKKISPETRVFVSFQWEWMRILDAREPHRIAEHSKVVHIFRPALDVVGLTTYPSAFHRVPEDLAPDYFRWLRHYVTAEDEILLMEVGWPTEGSGSETEQQRFVQKLPVLLQGMNVSVVAWALLHDVGLAAFDADLNTVGLLTREGRKKAAFEAFEQLHRATQH
jgi:hypothetical protein